MELSLLLPTLKKIYTGKTIKFDRWGEMRVTKVFAMGDEDNAFYCFVYDNPIQYVEVDEDGLYVNFRGVSEEYDFDEMMEKQLENHLRKYYDDKIVISLQNHYQYEYWRYLYPVNIKKQFQLTIHE
jgi:hypothetical protein